MLPPTAFSPFKLLPWLCLGLCTVAACGDVGAELGTTSHVRSSEPAPDAATATEDLGPNADGQCSATWLGSELGTLIEVTEGGEEHPGVDVSCSSTEPSSNRYMWEAPTNGCFRFTGGAGPGVSMLQVFSESCDGDLLGCRENAVYAGIVRVALTSEERVVVALTVTRGSADGTQLLKIELDEQSTCSR